MRSCRPRHGRGGELLRLRDRMADATEDERLALQRRLATSVAQRIFVGSRDDTAMERLRDRAGRDRIRMFVDADGAARLEFLDVDGSLVQSFPERRSGPGSPDVDLVTSGRRLPGPSVAEKKRQGAGNACRPPPSLSALPRCRRFLVGYPTTAHALANDLKSVPRPPLPTVRPSVVS